MSFDQPRILWFLILVAAYAPFAVSRYRKSRHGAALFAAAAPSGERESLFRELKRRIIISDAFFALFACCVIIALAGPRWGERIVADYRRGVDVVLAFDLSRSMNAEDYSRPPENPDRAPAEAGASRLDRGVAIARELVSSLGDLRFGAVIGKGRGVLAVPLTYDSEALLAFLGSLDSQALTGRGTNLESLVNAAAGSFQDSIPSRRGIVLFSDGETHSGSFEAAAERARKAGISLSSVGLGSEQGKPVPVEKSPEAPDGFLLGEDGKPVISSRQDEPLRNGAERTGGVYVDGESGDAAQALARYINSLSAESRLSGHRREANPRWRIFVLAAMACLGCARVMGFSRRGRGRSFRPRARYSPKRWAKDEEEKKKPGKALPVLFCAVLALASSCGRAQGKLFVMEGNFFNSRGFHTEAIKSYLKAMDYEEAAPYAEYGLGAAYFALEEDSAALERYHAAEEELAELNRQEHQELRYRICYNKGIILFEQGEYGEAANAFRDALKVDGSRIEAKRNLELSLLTINRNSSPQTAPQGNAESGREAAAGGSGSALFEYLRQKEQEQWKSREWSEESDSAGPDY